MLLLPIGLDITGMFLLRKGWWATTGSGDCTAYFTQPPSSSKYWPASEFANYFTPRWLSTAICCREFLKQLGAVKMDKSNPLDVCQKPHSASGSLYLADAYLADLSETFPLIPFTVWESLLNQHKIFPQPLKMHPGSSGKCLWDQICLLPIAYSLALISFLRCDVLCCL